MLRTYRYIRTWPTLPIIVYFEAQRCYTMINLEPIALMLKRIKTMIEKLKNFKNPAIPTRGLIIVTTGSPTFRPVLDAILASLDSQHQDLNTLKNSEDLETYN